MSSFYTDASLVMIPSGYKDQKVYCAKPVDGSADLTFSRASNATRVNSSGLVEKVRTNLLTYSEQFDNAAWVKTSTGLALAPVVTANAGIAPDGTTTADRVVFNATAGGSVLLQNVSGAVGYTLSIYVKSNTGSNQSIQLRIDSAPNAIITATTEWQRFTVTASSWSASTRDVGLDLRTAVATSADLLVWGAQWEASDVVTDYIATTTAAVSVGPTANVPRLDYSGGASCPSLLLEPQRTNLNTYSEDISLSVQYLATRVTISKNSVVSPDGYQNADKIVQDPSNTSWGGVAQGISPAGLVTLSLFAKKIDNDYIAILGHNSIPTAAWFNIATGTAGTTQAGVTSSKIEAYGNGWYRCSITTSVCNRFSVFHTTTDGGTTAPVNSETALWGFQQEDGATYATSYIPTLSSAVTRLQDSAENTSASSIIGQTEGTIFAQVGDFPKEFNGRIIAITQDSNNYITILKNGNYKDFYTLCAVGGASQMSYQGTGSLSDNAKIAVAYANNDFVIYVNGTQVHTDTSGNVPTCSNLFIGKRENGTVTYSTGGSVSQALLFKTRLSNADLATLTA